MGKKKFEEVSPTSALDADLLAGAASVGGPPPVAPVTPSPPRAPAPQERTEKVVEKPRPARPPASPPATPPRTPAPKARAEEVVEEPRPTRPPESLFDEDETPRQASSDEAIDAIAPDGLTLDAIQDLHAVAEKLRSRQAAMETQLAELLEPPE